MNAKLPEPTSVVDLLASALRSDIIEGKIPSGTSLPEVALATTYGVARPTAKAALERLTQEGILRRSFNRTAQVPDLDVQDISDLYQSRGFLEREVVRVLALRRDVPQAARSAHESFRSHIGTPSLLGIVESDISFHWHLLDALGSARLTRMYAIVIGEMRLCMAQVQQGGLLRPEIIASEHEDIMAAIEAGDAESAARTMDEHLQAACERLVTLKHMRTSSRSGLESRDIAHDHAPAGV